jgi:hypothetical protein
VNGDNGRAPEPNHFIGKLEDAVVRAVIEDTGDTKLQVDSSTNWMICAFQQKEPG